MLHDNVRAFDARALIQNKTISEFIIPERVTSIGEWAFYNTTISSIKIHSGVTFIGSRCFLSNVNLNSATIDTNVLSESCFAQCSALQKVDLAEGFTTIPRFAFDSCTSLNIELPKSLTKIEEGAFTSCLSLTEISIPEKVDFIGPYAFSGCISLEIIYSYPMIAPQITQTSFGIEGSSSGTSATNKQLIVKSGSIGYESGYWTDVINRYTIKYTL